MARLAAVTLFVIGLCAGLLVGDAASRPPTAAVADVVGPSGFDPEFDPLAAAPAGSLADILLLSLAEPEQGGLN
jgi:hypothetical protein